MIELANLSKIYHTRQGRRTVLDGINLRVAKGEKIGVLGRNGAGKSTMIRMISGAELPSAGKIRRGMSVSWPLAFGGAFQGSLT
ncbi:ATP-binding cassette domain-containing protein, partial [Brevundimonas diminuta]